MHPVYHAKITVSTKNFPRSEGRKCGVKGLVQWRGLMVWSRSWFRTTRPRHFKKFFACSGAFGENSPKVDPQFYRCPATMGNDWGSSCHGYTDRGRVERGIERELYFTEPQDVHISPISSPVD